MKGLVGGRNRERRVEKHMKQQNKGGISKNLPVFTREAGKRHVFGGCPGTGGTIAPCSLIGASFLFEGMQRINYV